MNLPELHSQTRLKEQWLGKNATRPAFKLPAGGLFEICQQPTRISYSDNRNHSCGMKPVNNTHTLNTFCFYGKKPAISKCKLLLWRATRSRPPIEWAIASWMETRLLSDSKNHRRKIKKIDCTAGYSLNFFCFLFFIFIFHLYFWFDSFNAVHSDLWHKQWLCTKYTWPLTK